MRSSTVQSSLLTKKLYANHARPGQCNVPVLFCQQFRGKVSRNEMIKCQGVFMIRKWVGGLLFLCLFCIVGCADGKTEKKPAAEYGKAVSEEKYETAYIEMTQEEKKKAGERITEVMEACRGIYESAEKGSADDVSLKEDVVHQMVEAAASEGRAVTCGNYDYNLQNYKDVDLALKEAGQGEKASAEYYKITASGTFQYYGLEAEGKELIVTYVSAVFQEDMRTEIRQMEKFQVYDWEYTDKGWLIWEKALSKNQEMDMHSFCRILPLDEECRKMGNQYVLPVSYFCNNLFLADWDQTSMDHIEFNDLYEYLYAMKYGEKLDEASYQEGIPKGEFEGVIRTYFDISVEELERIAGYDAGTGSYPWEAVGPWNRVQQIQPFPEVVKCTDHGDGTVTLEVEAILVEEGLDCAFRHEVTMKKTDQGWMYLGNRVDRENAINIPAYRPRSEY